MSKQPPTFLFAAVGLHKGSGGIAELSRQVFRSLLELHHRNRIRLEVNVLEESGPQAGDDLFNDDDLPTIRWFGGSRWRFALSLVFSGSNVRMLDHVGLGRLPAMLPQPASQSTILLIHGIEIWNNTRADYHRTARKADLLIANSTYTARKARAHYPDLPKIRVCWPGKDISVAPEATSTEPLATIGPHAMLIVGRLSAEQRHKGHDHLLEALPLILQKVPDAQQVIAGAGDDQPRLEAKARELNVTNQVIFTGWVNEAQLAQLYFQCALFVMPSDGDGFGLVFLEAMMHRMPCVGLRSGAAAEIFEDEKSGILVDRDDHEGLANRLTGLLLDEEQRERLGKAGRKRYESHFQAKHHSQRLQSTLQDFLAHVGADSSAN